MAIVRGYRTQNDGGGGEFYFLKNWTDQSGTAEFMPKIPGLAPPADAITSDFNATIEGTHFRPPTGKPGRWVRAGCAIGVKRVRRPEEWGADGTGANDSTYALQVALNWCRDNHAYLQGTGRYKIASTLYVTGVAWGFEFGSAGDIHASSGGLLWYGGDHVAGVSESTYKPMLHLGWVQPPLAGYEPTPGPNAPGIVGLQCGPICLNNRINASKGICGLKWTAYTNQCSGCDFKQIEIYGMDAGLILGTRAQTSGGGDYPRDDVAENSIFSVVRMFEVKHPIYINGSTNDMITFDNVNVGVYQESGGAFWNGPSSYGIRVNSLQTGLTFRKITLGHQDMVPNEALIDIVSGGVEIGHANLENGGRTCLGVRVGNLAGGRGPVILRNIYTHGFADSSGNVAQFSAAFGVFMEACTWRGNVNILSNTGFVTGSCVFAGNYNFVGSVDRRVSVAIMKDADANYVVDNKRVGGPHNADTYNALTSIESGRSIASGGTIKNAFVTELVVRTDNTTFPAGGSALALFTVVLPTHVWEAYAIVDVDCLFYQGSHLATEFLWKATARYMIFRPMASHGNDPAIIVKTTASVPSDADKLFYGGITTATAVPSATFSGDTVTLWLAHSNSAGTAARGVLRATLLSPQTVTIASPFQPPPPT